MSFQYSENLCLKQIFTFVVFHMRVSILFGAKRVRTSSRGPRLKKKMLEMYRIYKKHIKFEKRYDDILEEISVLNFYDL